MPRVSDAAASRATPNSEDCRFLLSVLGYSPYYVVILTMWNKWGMLICAGGASRVALSCPDSPELVDVDTQATH